MFCNFVSGVEYSKCFTDGAGVSDHNGAGAPFGERHQADGGLHDLLRRGVLHQAPGHGERGLCIVQRQTATASFS